MVAMKIRYLVFIALMQAMASVFSVTAEAADLTFFVGGVKSGSINYHDVKTSLDGSPIYGARVGAKLVRFLGMEHSVAFSSDYLFPRKAAAIKDANGFVYNGNLIIEIPANGVVPFVTAGVGLMHQYGDEDLPVGTKFAVNYGGGVKFPSLAGPVGLRFDIRGYRAGVVSNKLNMIEVSGGVIISLRR